VAIVEDSFCFFLFFLIICVLGRSMKKYRMVVMMMMIPWVVFVLSHVRRLSTGNAWAL
jgi:hypothetical protein